MPDSKLTIPVSRLGPILSLLLGLLALAGAAWGGAGWAIRYKADEAINFRLDSEHLVRAQELENFRQLLDARLGAMERRQAEANDRLEYLYRRELERAERGGDRGSGR